MKLLKTIGATGLYVLMSATLAIAEPTFTKGVVKKVKPDDGKVTIIHEELVDLEMPAMTMVFRVADNAMFEKLEPGANIEFVAERVDGKLTVTDLK
ncbi:MAG: copper-binding protein [Pseudomonadota bacterium]